MFYSICIDVLLCVFCVCQSSIKESIYLSRLVLGSRIALFHSNVACAEFHTGYMLVNAVRCCTKDLMGWKVYACPKRMHSSGINGEGELSRQPANPGSRGKMAVNWNMCDMCVSVADRVVDRGVMQQVSVDIGQDWRALGRQLDCSDADLDALQHDYHHAGGLREIAYQMLREWTERCGSDAKLATLAQALVNIRRPDVALKLQAGASIPP